MLQPHLHSAFSRPIPGPPTPVSATTAVNGPTCFFSSLSANVFGAAIGQVSCSGLFGPRGSPAAPICPHPAAAAAGFHPLFPPLSLPSLAVSSWQSQFPTMASPDNNPLGSFYWSSGCSSMSPPLAMSCPTPSPLLPPLTQRSISATPYLAKSPVCSQISGQIPPPSYKDVLSIHRAIKREERILPSPRQLTIEEIGSPLASLSRLPLEQTTDRTGLHDKADSKSFQRTAQNLSVSTSITDITMVEEAEDEEVDILGTTSEPQDLSIRQCPVPIDSSQELRLRASSAALTSAVTSPVSSQDTGKSPGIQLPRFQPTTRVYTLKTFFQSDGRSKRHSSPTDTCPLLRQASSINSQMVDPTEAPGVLKNPVSGSVSSMSHEKRLPTCDICGKRYATQSNLSRHKQTHLSLDSPRAKECPHCGKRYVSSAAFSMHLSTHEKQFKCEVCHRPFSRRWLLMGHMRTHSGEKPYGCAHCGKAFADRSNLRAHMGTHANVKKHACERCGKRFAIKAYLNKHRESSCLKAD